MFNLFNIIYGWSIRFMPMLRVVWTVSSVVAIAMLVIAIVLKKNPERKKSPWIVGGIGLLMLISSGTQLMMSLFGG